MFIGTPCTAIFFVIAVSKTNTLTQQNQLYSYFFVAPYMTHVTWPRFGYFFCHFGNPAEKPENGFYSLQKVYTLCSDIDFIKLNC